MMAVYCGGGGSGVRGGYEVLTLSNPCMALMVGG